MPRRRRSFGRRNRSRSHSAPVVLCKLSNRPSKRKTWTNEQMVAAMKAVEEGQSINSAAHDHGVPKTTLKDRVSGRVAHGSKPGPKPYLTSAEEKELAEFLKSCAKMGYGKTRRDIKGIAKLVAQDKGVLKGVKISDGWWRRFLERQPKLTLRRGDSTAHVRMDTVNRETMDQYFALLKDVMEEHSLFDKPS